ncbi:hypothetical protein SLE2022_382310 [Rubroshorea leprosula]
MRFRKGNRVEVLSKAVAAGSWLCAEIISGNGHTYSVKYGWFPTTTEGMVHRVPRKAIRPCPPPVEGARDWIPGDLVEVFDNPYWKTAVVVKVVDGNNFFVRLIGSSVEFRVPRSHLRVRQCWEDGRWFLVGEGKRNTATRTKLSLVDDEIEKSLMISTRTPKKRGGCSIGLSEFEVPAVPVKKIRLIGKDSSSKRSLVLHPSPVSEKVDAFVSQQKVLGKKDMHASFHDRTTICTRVELAGENNRLNMGTSLTVDADSSISSVGSCSWNISNRLSSCIRTNSLENLEDYSSDAESHCGREYVEPCSCSSNVELRTDTHRSDLHAYRRALWALYASGPLSWEEEEKLTNLRCALHISNDEHLSELENLKLAHSKLPLSC